MESIVENGEAMFQITIAVPKDGISKKVFQKIRRGGYENMHSGR